MDPDENLGEAAQAAAESAALAVQAEIQNEHESAQAIVEAVTENAADRVEAAEEAAQEIADAAVMTAIGQRQSTLENEVRTWRENLGMQVSEMQSSLAALQETVTAQTAQITALLALSQTDQSSSIQAPSQETTGLPPSIVPNPLGSGVVESPAPLAAKRRHRLI